MKEVTMDGRTYLVSDSGNVRFLKTLTENRGPDESTSKQLDRVEQKIDSLINKWNHTNSI